MRGGSGIYAKAEDERLVIRAQAVLVEVAIEYFDFAREDAVESNLGVEAIGAIDAIESA